MFAFIQARMGSSRLPGKMALHLPDGKTLLEAVISRLGTHNITPVLLTTTQPSDDALVEIANQLNLSVFRGDENHVLHRFTEAAKHFQIPNDAFILRICADNPYLSHWIIDQTIQKTTELPQADYISYSHQNKPGIKHHTGIFVEAVKVGALNAVETQNNPWYNEHVTIGVYENPNLFNISYIEIPTEWHPHFLSIRLTIDDADDWAFCQATYDRLSQLDFPEQRTLLLSEKSWVTLMENQINKYQK
jgi:spore coat polysaccharide biosynthesis protein SpsF